MSWLPKVEKGVVRESVVRVSRIEARGGLVEGLQPTLLYNSQSPIVYSRRKILISCRFSPKKLLARMTSIYFASPFQNLIGRKDLFGLFEYGLQV